MCLFLLCAFSQAVQAKKLYKYQDEQGRWFYSDKPPKTDQKIEVRQLKASNKRYVWLEKAGDKHNPHYFVINNYPAVIEIEVQFTQQQNVSSTPKLPSRFTVQSGRSDTLIQVQAIDRFKSWRYGIQYSYTMGNPAAQHKENTVYFPPFAKNTEFQISQAFAGKFSHTDDQNKYAIDLALPVNTPIHAARAGKVIEVNNDFFNSGTKQTYKSRANSIRILHEDGSMAIYAHLALEKAQVYPGLNISARQLIGFSGNTGYSTGPHLHFSVQLNSGMKLESVPFKFTDFDGRVFTPTVGMWLKN
jgi:murein DD-endopeptidase MepM/ murein hydrolase activator NlpD